MFTSEPVKSPFDLLVDQIREVVRDEIKAAGGGVQDSPALLTPEELAGKMNIPVSWVYEQSCQGEIPTRRIGRYIRFNLTEVLESQKKKELVVPLTRVK